MNSLLLVLMLAAAGGPWKCAENADGVYQCNAKDAPVEAGLEQPYAASDGIKEPVQDPELEPGFAAEPAPAPGSEDVVEAMSEPSPVAAVGVVDNYLVQIAAYRDLAQAQQRISKMDDELRILPIATQDEGTWYLIILGSFPDRSSAQAAGAAYAEEYPEADYWVRNISGVRQLMIPMSAGEISP